MRLIVGITLMLLGIGTWSCRLEGLSVELPAQTASAEWVRTVDGWERPTTWQSSRVPPPRLHPLVVAFGQAMLTVLVLAAFCSADRGEGNRIAAQSGFRRAYRL